MKSKIGLFFTYVGLILLVIFFVTDQELHPSYGYFFGGLLLLVLGIFMMWSNRKPADPNTDRFRTLRSFRERKVQREARREEGKNK